MSDQLVDRVRRVIESSGGSQAEFAARIGLDPSKLSKSLTGIRRLTSLELALVAEAGGVSVDWLLTGVSAVPAAVAARASRSDLSAAGAAIERAEHLDELWSDVIEAAVAPPLPELPRWPVSGSATTQGTELAARALAHVTELGHRERMRGELPDVLEDVFGVNVAVEELPEGLDGLSWVRGDFRLALINTATSWTRQRFTLAHELGHILAGDADGILLDADVTPMGRPSLPEMRANAFAAALLMPEPELRERLPEGVDDLAFAGMVGRLRVSPSALAWRLLGLGLLDEVSRRRYSRYSVRACSLLGGWSDDYRLREREQRATRPPMPLARASFAAYQAGSMSVRVPAAVLGREPAEVLGALAPTELDSIGPGPEAVYVP